MQIETCDIPVKSSQESICCRSVTAEMDMVTILNILINAIIQNYFKNSRGLFLFFEDKNLIEYKGSLPVININIGNNTINDDLIFKSYGCQQIVIRHDNPSFVLQEIERKIKLHKDRFNFRKYIILPTTPSQNLSAVFELPELQYIVDFLVVIPITTTSSDANGNVSCDSSFRVTCEQDINFELVTHKYVGENDNNEPVLLDVWFSKNQSFSDNNNLYPDKMSNQEGRILRCATFNYKPYSILQKPPDVTIGSENYATHEYAKYHNITIEYVLDNYEWGIIYENWTGNGLLGNVAIGKADIAYGALYTWEHEFGFLDFSKPTVRSGITCLVPAPRLAAGWLTPLFPFSSLMWICTGLSYIVASFVTICLTFVISKHQLLKKNSQQRQLRKKKTDCTKIVNESLTSIFRIFLIQSLPSTMKELESALKYMFIIFLFGLLLSAAYSSGLASIMTVPRYENAINTVNDLEASGINWGATQDAWIYSIMAEEREPYKTLVRRFIATSIDNLVEFAKTNRFAFSVERLPSGHYAVGNYITRKIVKNLRLMHEDLYWEYSIFMLQKNSVLLHSVDNFVMRTFEAGLIKYWEMKAAETHMDLRVQNIVKYYAITKKEANTVTKLQWVHVEGAFAILTIGYVIAGVSFIIEHIIAHKRKPSYKNYEIA